MENSPQEIRFLQNCINDLMSVLALPAIWSGGGSSQVVITLLDALVGMLRLDFAYARFLDNGYGSEIDILRLANGQTTKVLPRDVGLILKDRLTNASPAAPALIPNPIGEGEVFIAPLRLGLHDEIGFLIAASKRRDFPTRIETLLLRVAANQAVVGLQEAQLLGAQKQAAEVLEQKIADRTRQVTAINAELVREIGVRERAEEELRRSEAFLAEGQRISHTGSWTVKFPSGSIFWSREVYRIYGLDPATTKLSVEMAFQLIHFEDRAFVQQAFERAMREKGDYSVEHRAIVPDGTIKYLHALGHPVLGDSGDLVEYIGTVVDITERKRADEELRKTHERTEMILDSITDKFFAVDKNWRYTDFNKHAEEQLRLLGKNPASLIGKVLWDEYTNPTSAEQLRRAMSEREAVTDEQYYPLLGEWYENRIYPNPDGGLAIFQRYVTQRKQAEQRLLKSEETYRTLFDSIDEGFCTIEMMFDGKDKAVDYRFLEINPSFEKQTGIKHALGRTMREISPQHEDNWFEIYGKVALTGAPARFENPAAALRRWYDVYAFRVGKPRERKVAVLIKDITKRKRAEEALRASEERFRRYFELGLIGMAITSPDKGCLEVNDELCRILGYERSELLQKNWAEITHPDDLAADVAQFNRVLTGEINGYSLDKRWIRKDGRIIDSVMAAKCVRRADGSVDYLVGLVQDITERKQAEKSVRTARERVDMIVNSISDNFFSMDRAGRFTYFNTHAADQMRTLGKDPDALIGKVAWEEFPEAPNKDSFHRVLSERVVVADELYYAPLGEWIENHIYPSNDGGLVTFQRYITRRKQMEDELHKAQAELAHVARVTTLGELTASIAHEVNQPLAAIVTNGQASLRLLSRSKPDIEEAREAVQSMIDDSLRASEVIKRIRALLKKSGPAKSPLSVNEFIQEVIAFTSAELKQNKVSLLTELGSDLPVVIGDRVQLQQVVLNLILNGNEAMNSPEWETRELLLRSERSGPDRVLVTVQDTGIGLNSKDQERVFDAFFTRKEGGLGLGLSISRTIIEGHGGRLWATPNEGPGTSFQFLLPTGVGNQ